MTTQLVEIRDAATGTIVDQCRGPTHSGACPRAGRDGVVACANRLIAPLDADPLYWPLWVPPKSRHCALGWNLRARHCLREAETYHDQWLAGLAMEINHVKNRAEDRDARFEHMTRKELEKLGFWRWSHSPRALALDAWEQYFRERARVYLAFADFRLRSTPP